MKEVLFKAAISVFLCCLIYEFFDVGTGIPFYSGIAAVICLQPGVRSTFRVGLNRTIGTLIGGFTGMAVLFIIRVFSFFKMPVFKYLLISACILPLMYIAEAVKNTRVSEMLKNIANTLKRARSSERFKEESNALLLTAPLLFIADFMRKSALTSITCVAFLSVTITHGVDSTIDTFALNRILDTLIGVFISFFVNIVPLGNVGRVVSNEDKSDPE